MMDMAESAINRKAFSEGRGAEILLAKSSNTPFCESPLIKGIDQKEKGWDEFFIIRMVSLRTLHAGIFKRICADPIL